MKKILLMAATLILLRHGLLADEDLGYQGQSNKGSKISSILDQLKNDPNNHVRIENGWTIIETKNPLAIWSFAPETHPAFPAFAKRKVVEENGSIHIKTEVTCGATKTVCDDFVRSFIELNQSIKRNVDQN